MILLGMIGLPQMIIVGIVVSLIVMFVVKRVTKKEGQKSSVIKDLFAFLGVAVVIIGVGLFLFVNYASDKSKGDVLEEFGMENTGIARDIAKESFLKCEITKKRKNLMGDKWVIQGNLFTNNKTMNFTRQKIRFEFSDGSEIYKFKLRINGSQFLKRSFEVRIEGHSNATFLGAQVIEVQ